MEIMLTKEKIIFGIQKLPDSVTIDEIMDQIILYQKLMKLILSLSAKNIPMIFIHFPKLTRNPIYLYSKLKPVFKNLDYRRFEDVFYDTVNITSVHSFRS